MSSWVGATTSRVGSTTGQVESANGWVGCTTGWVGNSIYGEGRGARHPWSLLMAWTIKHSLKGGGTANSRGPPGTGGQQAQEGLC